MNEVLLVLRPVGAPAGSQTAVEHYSMREPPCNAATGCPSRLIAEGTHSRCAYVPALGTNEQTRFFQSSINNNPAYTQHLAESVDHEPGRHGSADSHLLCFRIQEMRARTHVEAIEVGLHSTAPFATSLEPDRDLVYVGCLSADLQCSLYMSNKTLTGRQQHPCTTWTDWTLAARSTWPAA